jgi:two-component system LytT family sensor kinase
MKKVNNIRRFTFYLWVGLAYLMLWVLGEWSGHGEWPGHPGMFWIILLNEIWRTSYIVVVNYVLFEYSVPAILRHRKFVLINILLALVLFFAHLFLYTIMLYIWKTIGAGMGIYNEFRNFKDIKQELSFHFGFSVGSFFFFGIIRHIYNYVKLKASAQRLLIEKQLAELNFLKSQTNPHFLFNTLNNIYSLARDKSDLAPESILRLSKILRFMLYDAGGAFVAIEQELKIVSDYIALEKLRYDESLRVTFSNDIEDMKQALPPLLLIPLVENAFKHGVSETRTDPFVDIYLSVNKRQLLFIVKNSTEDVQGKGRPKENIGLSNLRRQLELLYTDYNLSVQYNDSGFSATLKINLASHVQH